MRRGMMALVGAGMLSWSGTSLAAGLADRALGFEGSFASVGVASPGLSLPHAGPLHLMPRGGKGREGAVRADDSIRGILAVVLALLVGFGSGHFVLGDGAAWLFLGLEVGTIVGAIVTAAAAAALLATGSLFPIFAFAAPVLVLGFIAVKIWEVVDIILKSGIADGPKPKGSEVIVPRTGGLARSAFQPATANGLNLRF